MAISTTKKVALAFLIVANLGVVADDYLSIKKSQTQEGNAEKHTLVNKGIKTAKGYLVSEFGELKGNLILIATTTVVGLPLLPGKWAGEALKKSID